MAAGEFNNKANKATNSWMETAWEKFSPFELVMWVHLFTKSGTIRQQGENPEKKDIEKSVKDLHMARHYLDMLAKKIKACDIDPLNGKTIPAVFKDPAFLGETMEKNYGGLKNDPSDDAKEIFGAHMRGVFANLMESLDAAENNARPEVKTSLEQQSHWKKNPRL